MDITQIVVVLIGLISVILTGLIIPYIKSKTTTQQQEIIMMFANIAVYAAQQLFVNNAEKFSYATEYMYAMLDNASLKVDRVAVTAAIESALKQAKMENPKWKG